MSKRSVISALLFNSIVSEMEYRANTLINLTNGLISASLTIYALWALFQNVGFVGGWTIYQVMALFGVALILEGLIECWLFPSLHSLSEKVRRGELDFILLLPVDSQILISFTKLNLWYAPRVLIGVSTVLASMIFQGIISFENIALFIFFMAVGILVFYSFFLFTCTLSIWFVKVADVWILSYTMMEVGRFPVRAYPKSVQVILTVIFPVAFTSTVPAEAAMGMLKWEWMMAATTYAVAAFWASRLFWKFSLSHYNSASS